MKIEAGKHYKSRNGTIFGPMMWNSHYNLWKANGLTWVIGGQFYSGDEEHKHDLIEEVTVNVPLSTFPTEVEFSDWFANTMNGKALPSEYYEYFHDRVKPIEIGKEYEFSANGKTWVRDRFNGYGGHISSSWKHVRPIQTDPEPDLLDSLRAWQKGDLAFDKMPDVLERAIKALEGEE